MIRRPSKHIEFEVKKPNQSRNFALTTLKLLFLGHFTLVAFICFYLLNQAFLLCLTRVIEQVDANVKVSG